MPELSIIIPVKNEESNIGNVIGSIKSELHGLVSYEIVVIDNRSTDNTAEAAKQAGADLTCSRNGTISELRNFGVTRCRAPIIAFIDADVVVCTGWGLAAKKAMADISRCPPAVIGAHYGYGSDPAWIERAWLNPVFRKLSSYVPGGNMIISSSTFEAVGGFSADLATGEDVDLCRRVVDAGGSVIVAPDLVTHHLGNPKTLTGFVRRERWHGVGDFQNFATIARSKVAVATLAWVGLHLAMLIASFTSTYWIIPILFLLAVGGCTAISVHRFRWDQFIFHRTMIQYFYFLGRTLAAVDVANTRFRALLHHTPTTDSTRIASRG